VLSDIKDSITGRPRKILPKTIISFRINFPANVALANFHGLYFASPSGIYTKSSGIGVTAAAKAPGHPYFETSLCKVTSFFLF